MQSRQQRGRVVQRKPFNWFYVILGVVVIGGIAAIATIVLSSRGSGASSSSGVVNPGDLSAFPSLGDANAPVTVVEYSDFQCPYCALFAVQQKPAFVSTYIDTGKVRLVYHDMPLTQHRNSVAAAEAGRCAADQNAFWKLHDLLFAKQTEWESLPDPKQQFGAYAQQVGLDTATFNQCLSSGKHNAAILAAKQQAYDAQIPATPSFVINGKVYQSNELNSAVEQALAAK